MNEILYTPNNVDIAFVELYNYAGKKLDITKLFRFIEIDEDIFSSVLSGRIGIADTNDLHQNFPLIGEETLTIKFRTMNGMPFRELKFAIFNDAGKSYSGEVAVFVLEFSSEEYITSRSFRLDTSFKNMTSPDIISNVLKNNLGSKKTIYSSKSTNSINFVATNIFPFELVSSLLSRSRGDKFGDYGLMFWESMDGFHLESIDELISSTPLVYTLSQRSGISLPADCLQVINAHVVEESFNLLDRMTHGAFGTETVIFDPIKRTTSVSKFDYFNNVDYESLNNMSGQSPNLRIQTSEFKYKNAQKRVMKVSNGVRSDGMSLRLARLNWIESGYRIRVEIPGNSDARVGNVFDVRWPSHTGVDMKELKLDKYVSGKYLNTSMRHVITAGHKYICNCVLVKDSLDASPERESGKTSKRVGMI